MFGGPLPCPKEPKPRPRPPLHQTDIAMPSPLTGTHAHHARPANTDYAAKLLHYKQREFEEFTKEEHAFNSQGVAAKMYIRYQEHAVKKRFQAKIQERLKEKLANYEQQVEKRRDKLKEILGNEEREHIRETVDQLQKADDSKIHDMKVKYEAMLAAREAERLAFVQQKRIQQYANRCVELRPYLTQKRLEEAKLSQLQQMRENEARREAERELDRMWEAVARQHDDALFEREMQEAIMRYEECRKDKQILLMQIKAKKLMEEERKSVELENRRELERSQTLQAAQEAEERMNARMKSVREADELKEQVRIQQQFVAQRLKEEKALDDAFALLGELEVKRAEAKNLNTTAQRRKEAAMYREHLHHLQEQRKADDKHLEEILEMYRLEQVKKQDELMCKRENAKRQQRDNMLNERAKQIELNRQRAAKELEFKKNENEMLRSIIETNQKLIEESERLAKEAVKQYRADLKQQIDYNHQLRVNEMQELERQLEVGLAEEKKYMAIVNEVVYGDSINAITAKHPFRKVLEKYDCHCPTNIK